MFTIYALCQLFCQQALLLGGQIGYSDTIAAAILVRRKITKMLFPFSLHELIEFHFGFVYRVTIQVVPNLPLTSKHKLCFSTWASYLNGTFVLMSTEVWHNPNGHPVEL